jgi:hypothetical protein
LRSCLLIREGRPPVETLEVASVLLELALLMENKGNLEEGEEAARRALIIRERILGSQHPDVGVALLGTPHALPSIIQLLFGRHKHQQVILINGPFESIKKVSQQSLLSYEHFIVQAWGA